MKQHDPLPVFGQRLRARRYKKYMTMAELSRQSGIGAPEIRALENDPQRGTNIRVLRALAVVLDCSTDWLLGLSEKMERST